MKPLLIFLLKIIASVFGVISGWCDIIVAAILWDDKFMIPHKALLDKIWKKDEKTKTENPRDSISS